MSCENSAIEKEIMIKSLHFASNNETNLKNSIKFYCELYGVSAEDIENKIKSTEKYKEYIENGGC